MNDEVTAVPAAWRVADELVLAQVEARLLGTERPVTIGRYRIERDLGRGGMGRLLLAFDPDLQRKVALKSIAPAQASSPEARRRIVAEARAMARLSDPHVAQVYEVDEHGGELFVAIEYVDGEDLRAWLDGAPRAWRSILDVFEQAGAGLAAAHEHGIVHRDFKPDNVMLDRRGRARVIDFGLARGGVQEPGGAASFRTRAWSGAPELTRTGSVLGTPPYMAPEQWDGGIVDAKSDQFAFCVALFEAITGQLPFAGAHEAELRASLRDGPSGTWPRSAPRWLQHAIVRGLAFEPDARWPDMRALLRAIDPVRRRRRSIALGMFGVTVALATTAAIAAYDPCRDAGDEIAAVWTPEQRALVLDAAVRADASWGATTGIRASERFDAHAQTWADAATSVCRSERRDTTTARACLSQSRARLVESVDELLRGDPRLLVSSVARAELLPSPSACVDPPSLAAYADPSPDVRGAVGHIAAAELHLGAMTVRGDADGYRDAIEQGRVEADAAIAAAEQSGDEVLLGRALALAGRLQLAEGDHARAEVLLRRGLAMARRAADAPTAAAITADLVYAVSREQPRIREAEDLAAEAAGMIEALASPPLLHARLLAHRASGLAHAAPTGPTETDAVGVHEQVIAELEQTLGATHPSTIIARGNLGTAQSYAGEHVRAEQVLTAAIVDATHVWGESHPRTAALLGALGLARLRAGELESAELDLRRSLELRASTLGDAHPQVDDARYNLAMLLRRRGEHREAARLLEAGVTNVRTRVGDDDGKLGPWWFALGESRLELHDASGARDALGEAQRIFERTGEAARDFALVRFATARAWQGEDAERARMLALEARADALEARAATLVERIDAWLASPS